jgi:hypothetical protein
MTKEELEKILEQAKPFYAPFGCQLSIVSVAGDDVKLKMVCPPLDMFKVQGKLVSTEDELKKKIAARVTSGSANVKVTFVQ